jgi:hypothetical protein
MLIGPYEFSCFLGSYFMRLAAELEMRVRKKGVGGICDGIYVENGRQQSVVSEVCLQISL